MPLLFFTAATAILIWALPRRSARVFRPRKPHFPFARAGQILIALTLLFFAVIFALWVAGPFPQNLVWKAFSLVLMLMPVGLYLIRQARRVREYPTLNQVLKRDAMAPVLYLRSFKQESQFFVVGEWTKYGGYAKSFLVKSDTPGHKIGLIFEEYLSDELAESIGPCIALGSPEDYIAPEGALRTYSRDAVWTKQVDKLARRATCIITEVGKSENLRWEFEHLRREGLQEKLVVVTHHGSRPGPWSFWGLVWLLRGLRPVKWRDFCSDLRTLGYEIDLQDPGPGSVIGFDAIGRGVLSTTQADLPEEFVRPVHTWLTSREIVGRHVSSLCARCGQQFFAAQSADGSTREKFCSKCEGGLNAFEQACLRLRPAIAGVFGFSLACLTLYAPSEYWVARHPLGTWIVAIVAGFAAYCIVAPLYEKRVAHRILKRYFALADAGDAGAMCRLGDLYREGRRGLAIDDSRATFWYQKAADITAKKTVKKPRRRALPSEKRRNRPSL